MMKYLAMTHVYTIVEFGQVAIYAFDIYFCVTIVTLEVKYLLQLMRLMVMEVYIMQ